MNNDLWINFSGHHGFVKVSEKGKSVLWCMFSANSWFCRFFFLIFYFIVSFTADYPQSHGLCCQGYDNHMIQQQNRIGQWVCSVICVGVCDCDESLLKLECLVLGNFLMRLSRIWEKIPEEKNKMLYYATSCFVVFTMSNQLGTKCFNLIYW